MNEVALARLEEYRAATEAKGSAKHEFYRARTDLLYEPRLDNLAGETALVLGKLLDYTDAWRRSMEAEIAFYEATAEDDQRLVAYAMAERLRDQVEERCRTEEEFRRDQIVYRVLLLQPKNREGLEE
jgi:hypothetical protein